MLNSINFDLYPNKKKRIIYMETQDTQILTSNSKVENNTSKALQPPLIPEEDSKRITALRFLLIAIIVFLHNNLNHDMAVNYYHLDFNEPVVITWFKTLIGTVFGIAPVPLFFLFAGYLQFCKKDKYTTLLKKRAKSLLIPYIAFYKKISE